VALVRMQLVVRQRPEMRVPFISGSSDESVIRHGPLGPGRAFPRKPFRAEVLLREVRESLDGGIPLSRRLGFAHGF